MDQCDRQTLTSLRNVIGLVESTGRCAQVVTKTVIDAVGFSTLARRDAWLSRFSQTLLREVWTKLRAADFNLETLFTEDDIGEAKELEAIDSAKVQDKFSQVVDERAIKSDKCRTSGASLSVFRPSDGQSQAGRLPSPRACRDSQIKTPALFTVTTVTSTRDTSGKEAQSILASVGGPAIRARYQTPPLTVFRNAPSLNGQDEESSKSRWRPQNPSECS